MASSFALRLQLFLGTLNALLLHRTVNIWWIYVLTFCHFLSCVGACQEESDLQKCYDNNNSKFENKNLSPIRYNTIKERLYTCKNLCRNIRGSKLKCARLMLANRRISQIPQCIRPISHNTSFKAEMHTFLFWMVYCGIWDRYIVVFVKFVYSISRNAWFRVNCRSVYVILIFPICIICIEHNETRHWYGLWNHRYGYCHGCAIVVSQHEQNHAIGWYLSNRCWLIMNGFRGIHARAISPCREHSLYQSLRWVRKLYSEGLCYISQRPMS